MWENSYCYDDSFLFCRSRYTYLFLDSGSSVQTAFFNVWFADSRSMVLQIEDQSSAGTVASIVEYSILNLLC